MRYLLRRAILEDRWEAQLEELITLCKCVPIEEVLLKEQSHQMLMAPWPLPKHERMAEIYCRIADKLREHGIRFSVNMATLVGHADTWVSDTYLLPYGRFMGWNLKEAHACYCILDQGWQDYAAKACALYAQAKPDKLFVDDDFRTVNHSSSIGCLCALHATETGKALGISLTSQELRTRIEGNSEEDREVRKAWMRINFEGMLQSAGKIHDAVAKVSNGTRVGLMTGVEEAHAIQGRNNDRLLREFSGPEHRPLIRPTGCPYCDVLHSEVFMTHQRMVLSMITLGEDVEIVSEVENWPHTPFTKSVTSTRLEMFFHALAGADGISLNIYDFLATPFVREPQWETLLQSCKEPLKRVAGERKGKRLRGFGIPWKSESILYRKVGQGGGDDLTAPSPLNSLLAQFGIPTQFTPSEANALLGTDVLAYSDAEITQFLKGGLLLDAEAAEILIQRGFEKEIGCTVKGPLQMAGSERLDDPAWSGPFLNDLITARPRDKAKGGPLARLLVPLQGSRRLSTLLNVDMEAIGPGNVIFENSLGGRVATMAAPISDCTWAFRSRAWLVTNIIRWLMRDQLPVWLEDTHDIGLFYYENPTDGKALLAAVSGSLDPQPLHLQGPRQWFDLWSNAPHTDAETISCLEIRFFTSEKPR